MKSRLSNLLLIALLAATPVCIASSQAYADEDEGDRGGERDDDRDDDGDRGGGSGTGGTGSGTGASGSSAPSSASQAGNSGKSDDDSTEVKNAVQAGDAVSLNKLLNFVNSNYDGKVINVELDKNPVGYTYQVKLLTDDNKLRIVNLDAQKLKEQNTASLY